MQRRINAPSEVKPLLLLAREWAPVRNGEQPGDATLVVAVQLELRRAHRHEVVVVDALGQLRFDLVLAAAQQEGTDTPLQLVEVPVADWTATVVEEELRSGSRSLIAATAGGGFR